MQDNYQPPAADVSPKFAGDAEEQDLASFIGPKNTEYYLERFRRIRSGGSAGWHWPAFFITSGWLLYRKMWFYAFAYIILLPVTVIIAIAILDLVMDATAVGLLLQLIYFVFAFVVIPIMANRLYLGHAKRRIAKVRAGAMAGDDSGEAIAAAGGTNLVVALFLLIVPLAGVFAAIWIPAYQDYTVRAQVAEGMALAAEPKRAVTQFHRNEDRFPADNVEAGLPAPAEISGNYVVAVGVEDGAIHIEYGGASAALDGLTLYLVPERGDSSVLRWTCRSDDIADQWLPASCRD